MPASVAALRPAHLLRRLPKRTARQWSSAAIVAFMTAALSVVQLALPQVTAPAFAADPVAPPAAVNPTDFMSVVTTAGPTVAPAQITEDTVWGPQGSPYVLHDRLTLHATRW